MSDLRNDIQNMFAPPNRFSSFGQVLTRLRIIGFRSHVDTIIDISSPITAICGLNGTGKSTILHLAAVAYTGPRNYHISDFIRTSTLDPNPFTSRASVEYRYSQSPKDKVGDTDQVLTISRSSEKGWSGYKRRPTRAVFFAGVGLYLPKIEQRDFIIRYLTKLQIGADTPTTPRTRMWTCKVLGCDYDSMASTEVRHSRQEGEVVTVCRGGTSYSEVHMGFGEGRAQHIITTLEKLPEKSLVLLEEPETSLHVSAQYEFGKYLVDVVKERRHQVFLTTHSENLSAALPSLSLIYLQNTVTGICPIIGLTPMQAKSFMSLGHVKALVVLVEDVCAEAVLQELLRRFNPDFLRTLEIVPAGDAQTIGVTARTLSRTGTRVAAVRDADKGAAPKENIFKLPGTQPPEKELVANTAVKKLLEERHGVNMADFLASVSDKDHHAVDPRFGQTHKFKRDGSAI